MRSIPLITLVLWGCSGDGSDTPTKPTGTTEPTGTTDTGATTSTGATDTGTADTQTALGITNLTWRVHDLVETFVYVSWQQETAGEVVVEFSVDDGEWRSAPPTAGVVGANEQLVVGIPYGHDAPLRLRVGDELLEAAEPISIVAPPQGLPLGTLVAAESGQWLPEGNFLLTSISEVNGGWSSSGPFWTMVLDRQGRPVWAKRTAPGEWTLYAQVSVSGDHILYDRFRPYSFSSTERVYRSYLDEEIEEIDTPGFHHAFVELPDGTLAWASRAHGGGEALVEKAPGQKGETILWTCNDDWPEEDSVWGCSSNCLFYNQPTNSYLYSFYSSESVVEIDRASGSTMWWAGGVDGGYSFDPPDSHFYWQHGVSYTDAGTLLLSTHDAGGWSASTNYAREYVVDHDTETLTEVWSYDAEAYADTNGDTWRLPNGNTLHTLGSASEIKEVDAAGQTVWHVDFNSTKLLGRSEWIEDLYTLVKPQP